MAGDATDADFEAFFDDYTLDTNEQALNGDIFVYARNAHGQCIALDVYIADGETEITAGSCQKVLRDGHIYIQRGEQRYDVTGKELR